MNIVVWNIHKKIIASIYHILMYYVNLVFKKSCIFAKRIIQCTLMLFAIQAHTSAGEAENPNQSRRYFLYFFCICY
jgi:hypothetical protein